jgi:hypothetical protein
MPQAVVIVLQYEQVQDHKTFYANDYVELIRKIIDWLEPQSIEFIKIEQTMKGDPIVEILRNELDGINSGIRVIPLRGV